MDPLGGYTVSYVRLCYVTIRALFYSGVSASTPASPAFTSKHDYFAHVASLPR